MFPEFELDTEAEGDLTPRSADSNKTESERMTEFNKYVESDDYKGTSDKETLKDLERMATSEDQCDKQFLDFKKKVESQPEQVIVLICSWTWHARTWFPFKCRIYPY